MRAGGSVTLQGCLSTAQGWTSEEDAILVRAYAAGGVAAARGVLPHRSEAALFHRARRLGLYRRRPWSDEDDRRLRTLWNDSTSLGSMARVLGRTEATVFQHGYFVLRLPLGPPQGCEYLTSAALRCGFSTSAQLRRILAWAGVRLRRVRTWRGKRARCRYVDSFDVDRAVERWLETETSEAAARRLGMNGDRLRARFRKIGIATSREKQARVTEEDLARANAIAQWQKRPRRSCSGQTPSIFRRASRESE